MCTGVWADQTMGPINYHGRQDTGNELLLLSLALCDIVFPQGERADRRQGYPLQMQLRRSSGPADSCQASTTSAITSIEGHFSTRFRLV